jgi:hypothetical protein
VRLANAYMLRHPDVTDKMITEALERVLASTADRQAGEVPV